MSAARLQNMLRGFDLRSTGKWFLLASLVGAVSGVGAILFQVLGQIVVQYTLVTFAGFHPGEAVGERPLFAPSEHQLSLPIIVLIMGLGGLVSGFIVFKWAPEAEGHGTDAAIDSFHQNRGLIRARVPIVKTITSAITIGTGGSAGREGPIAQIGAGFGSFLATKLKLSDRDRRIMLAAGMAGGIGAIFRAPLAGAIFAGEILYREADIESDVIVPAAISSIVSYSVYSLFLPADAAFLPLFGNGLHYQMKSLAELLPMALMSIILVLAAVVYIRTFYGLHRLSKKITVVPNYLKPAIGAVLAGLVGVGLHLAFDTGDSRAMLAVLSTGYGSLQTALEDPGKLGITALLIIAGGKVLTTSLTISTGGSGGVFGPSMVIGGCVGAALGLWFQDLFGIETHPGAFAIIGMAGFFAGAAHAPISTIIMVSEMTGDYKLLLPTMWVSTLCFLLCRRWSLYEKQVPTRLESPAHKGDFIVDVLEGNLVKDVYQTRSDIRRVPESTSLDDIVHILAETHQHYFPVIDDEGSMVGIFSDDDVRAYLFDETIWRLAVARDVMITNVVSVSPDDDLNTALRHFTAMNLDELPVLDPTNSGKLLGMLTRRETIAFYNRRVMEHKQSNE
ncbi:MAG: chloride channel protein [Planctomycetota bacterium]|nr:chloride channel protein [Planctomycetota bacterium]